MPSDSLVQNEVQVESIYLSIDPAMVSGLVVHRSCMLSAFYNFFYLA